MSHTDTGLLSYHLAAHLLTMNCEACKNRLAIDELLRCVRCKTPYHFNCLNMSTAYYKSNLNELKTAWVCPVCINVTRRKGSNCNTPVRQQFDYSYLDTSNMSCDDNIEQSYKASVATHVANPPPPCSANTVSGNITIEQLSQLLDSKLDSKLHNMHLSITADIKKEIVAQIETLKSEFTATTDFLAEQQRDLKQDVLSMNDKIQELESQNRKLQAELSVIKQNVKVLDKSSRSCNLEIQSIPEKKTENLLHLLKKICEVIKTPLIDSDIRSIRRVAKLNPSSDRPRNIIVTLPSERHRDAILSAARRYNKQNSSMPLNCSNIGYSGDKRSIYIVEHLSPECKEIHAAARKWAKENFYKYVWVKYGRVYVRESDTAPAILIKDLSVLNKLLSSSKNKL